MYEGSKNNNKFVNRVKVERMILYSGMMRIVPAAKMKLEMHRVSKYETL